MRARVERVVRERPVLHARGRDRARVRATKAHGWLVGHRPLILLPSACGCAIVSAWVTFGWGAAWAAAAVSCVAMEIMGDDQEDGS